MNQKYFYIDSCIYLNLWQKERGSIFGKPFWLIAKEFLEYAKNTRSIIFYSGYLLKEISFLLKPEIFAEKLQMINCSPNFKRISLDKTEFNLAQKIEVTNKFNISFYDILHMLLAKKTNSILVTRDKKLLKIAGKYKIIAKKPEELY